MIKVRVRKKPDRETLQLYYVDPMTGSDVTKSAKTADWKEAERAAAKWEEELAAGLVLRDPCWEVFRRRVENEFLIDRPRNTVDGYSSAMNHIENVIGDVRRLSMLNSSVISQFAADLRKQVSQTRVATVLRHVRAILRWAETIGAIARAPKINVPRTRRRKLARSRAITHEEYNVMLETVPLVFPDNADQVKRLLEWLWLSGLRIGEAIEASWDSGPIQIDLDGGRYPRMLVYGEGQKSGDDEIVLLAPDCCEWLQQTPKKQRHGRIAPLGDPEPSRSTVSNWICQIGEKADIETAAGKYASAHDFRRSYGCRWSRIVRPFTLQRMMRHRDIKTTLDYYLDDDVADIGAELWAGFQQKKTG